MKILKTIVLFQLVGTILFFSGVLSSIVMNSVVGNSIDTDLIYYHRQFISKITYILTIPGMWIAIVSTFVQILIHKVKVLNNYWWIIISFLMILILINGTFFLSPLVSSVTNLASEGFTTKNLPELYLPLKNKEDMLGALNFMMALIIFCFFVFKIEELIKLPK
ncbi:MAG: hypothetical protein ACP5D9_03855 [Mariniphaga sp.]